MLSPDDLSGCPHLIRHWARQWSALPLAEPITCQWSPRLQRSLGRAYPQRKLIRLSLLLREPRYAPLFDEVLCHEAAHIIAYHQRKSGRRPADHGPDWQALVRLAGFEPRREFVVDSPPQRRAPAAVRYVHTCPVCQATRPSGRPQPRWRCVPCQNAGLEGKLLIHSRPSTREPVDV